MAKTVELLPVTFDEQALHMWADENFRRIVDAVATLKAQDIGGGTVGVGVLIPAGNIIAGTFGANAGNGDYTFPANLTVTGTITDNGVTIQGTVGRNYFKDTELSAGSGLRVGAAWGKYGIYSESGDVVVGSATNRISFQNDGLGYFSSANFYSAVPITVPYTVPIYLRGIDGNHCLVVPTIGSWRQSAWSQDGPCLVGWAEVMLATGADNHWQLICVQGTGVGVYSKFAVGSFSTNDVQWDPECITTYGGNSGISMRQRTRGWNDGANRVVLYAANDHLVFWVSGLSNIGSMGWNNETMNSIQTFDIAIPALGGGNTVNVQANGSWQVGYISSCGKHKTNIRDLKTKHKDNPIFKMRAVRFNWNPKHVVNGDEINTLHPDGVAGLIAEEVAAICPDAAIYAGDNPCGSVMQEGISKGDAIGIDHDRVIAYLIEAVQHLYEELGKRKN